MFLQLISGFKNEPKCFLYSDDYITENITNLIKINIKSFSKQIFVILQNFKDIMILVLNQIKLYLFNFDKIKFEN